MLPPLRMLPIVKARSWGGDRLARLGKPLLGGTPIGESWEVADLPDAVADGQSVVAEGPFAGRTLRSIRLERRDDLLGLATPGPGGAFPLLVKFLDARENLSLQVHPDDRYARSHPECPPKTEAWIVIDAEPGARLYRGLRPETTRDGFRAALAERRVLEEMQPLEVRRGDCAYLPSGICHALGGGILVAEVQTPSDSTFRVWDWDRDDPARPLHLEQALACMRFGAAQEVGIPALARFAEATEIGSGAMSIRRLCRAPEFTVEWREVPVHAGAEGVFLPIGPSGVPEIWMVLEGVLRFRTSSGVMSAPAGSTVLLPARVEEGSVECPSGSIHLRIVCPSPLDRAT